MSPEDLVYAVLGVFVTLFAVGALKRREPPDGSTQAPRTPRVDASRADDVSDAKIGSLIAQKQYLLAIKRYREVYGGGLKEAKEAIERIRDQRS